MVKKVDTAMIKLWDENVGAVSWLEDKQYAVFEYAPSFLKKAIDISPIHMTLQQAQEGNRIFFFPGLSKETYLGLPGLLADALPDKFGNKIIDAWLARRGRDGNSFSPVERLCYTGKRGMGALEFHPPYDHHFDQAVPIQIEELVELAQTITTERQKLNTEFSDSGKENAEAIKDILRVGTSAGGARPKAIIAMDCNGNVISGQTEAPEGYDYWLLKFDGVTDLELGQPREYGKIEYAYYSMAKAAGINMTECKILNENGRAHFMTKRFDRHEGKKLHMQSLCGLAHYDFNSAGAYSYEQAFAIMRTLELSKSDAAQQYRRMIFNVLARNQDDHTKNIAFLMNQRGRWELSPAFDVTYSHNPTGMWTNQHQMSINGKRDHFTLNDLITVGNSIHISEPLDIINEIISAVEQWPKFASEAGINEKIRNEIARNHRIDSVTNNIS